MKLKICGLFREEDIEYANQLKPDYIGFVFAKSKRQITPKMAVLLKQRLDTDIQAVGVFVNEDEEEIIHLLEQGIIDIAQLHGTESEEVIVRIKKATNKPVWKAIKVDSCEDIDKWKNTKADLLVLDNGKGTGECFDWNLLKNINRKYLLAGGINIKNIKEAILDIKPYGIDVSSGVENNGVKDFEKMKYIMEQIKGENKNE